MQDVHGISDGITGGSCRTGSLSCHAEPSRRAVTFVSLFIGGMISNVIYILYFNPKYGRKVDEYAPEPVPPEARLEPALCGAVILPITVSDPASR